ncbi:TPA: hypothetical protein ACH3X2_010322 [Trebouxia sp. C0005]
MRALAKLSTILSLLLLSFDACMPCRMAGAKSPSRLRCSSGRDGGLAAVCQRLQCSGYSLCGLPDSFWSRGHSLWTSAVEQRTQPCGAEDTALWSISHVFICLRSGPGEDQVPYNSAMCINFDSLLLHASNLL